MSSGFSYTSSIDLSATEHESDMLKLQVDDLQKRMDLMKATFDREKQRLQSEIEERKLDEKQQKSEFEESLFQLQSQVATQRSETRSKMKENVKLSTELDVFLTKVAERTNGNIETLEDVIQFIDQLKARARADAVKMREMDEKSFALSQEKEKLEEKLREKCEDIQDLKAHCDRSMDARKKEFEEAFQNMRARTKKQEKMLAKMASLIEELKNENDRLKVKEGEVVELEAKLEDQKMDAMVQVLEAKNVVLEAKLDEANKTIEGQMQQISELNSTVVASADEISEQMKVIEGLMADNAAKIESLEGLRARLKKKVLEVHKLKKAVKSLETNNVALETEVSELKLALQNRKVEEMPNVERQEVEVVKENPEFTEALSALEESLTAQTEEISRLHAQRSELLTSLKNANRVLETCEEFEVSLQKRVAELNEIVAEKNEKIQQITELSEKRDSSLFDEILEMLPVELYKQLVSFNGRPFADQIREIVRLLLQGIEMSQAKHDVEVKPSTDCEGVLLQHLCSACRLVRKLSGCLGVGIDKDEILRECARIGRYVDEHQSHFKEYAELGRLFDMKNDKIDVVTLTFLRMLEDESVLSSSPFRELYILFCCLVHVNKRLMTQMDEQISKSAALRAKIMTIDDIETKLIELEEWKEAHEREMEGTCQFLGKFVESPSEKLETLAQQVSELIEEKDKKLGELNDFIEQQKLVEERNSEIRSLKRQVRKQKKQTKLFCQEANDVTNEIRDGVVRMQQDHEVEVEQFENEVEDLKEINMSLVEHYKEKIQRIRDELEEKEQLNQELSGQIQTLKKEINIFFAKCATQEDEIKEAKDQISSLTEQLNRAIEHKNHYKQKAHDLEHRDYDLLTQLQTRSAELKTKYESMVTDLTSQLQIVKEELAKAQAEIDQFDKVKNDLLRDKARLTISERTLTVKLASLKQHIENGLTTNVSRETALQNKLESKMANQRIEHEKEQRIYTHVLNRCSELLFGHPLPPTVSVANINEYFTESLDAKSKCSDVVSVKDANEARKLLGTMSLVSGVSDVLYRVEQMTREESENSRVNESMATLQAYIKRKEENLGESAQWMSWAKSILVQVSEGAKVTDSPQKLRTQVEDILLSTVSRRTHLRKLETLRQEKKLLTTQYELLNPPPKRPVKSIRPVIVALALAIRLRKDFPCL